MNRYLATLVKRMALGATILAATLFPLHAAAADGAATSNAPNPATATQTAKLLSVELVAGPNGGQVLQLQLDGPVKNPAVFSVESPRVFVALDFAGTDNGTGKTVIPFNQGNVRSVNVVGSSGRTRVVINLQKMVNFDAPQVDGNRLSFALKAADTSGAGTEGSAGDSGVALSHAAPSSNGAKLETVRDVDFRRGKNGEAELVIDLSAANVAVDTRQQGKTLVVDILKARLPANLERSMDVSDFATPVEKVDSFNQGDNVHLAITPKGNWEYSSYQTDNHLNIEIRPVVQVQATTQQKAEFKGDKLSLNFQNVEVRTVLQVIAEFTGKNIVTSDTVTGNLTLRLKDVPWDQALDIILKSRGLDKRESGNVMWIAPRDELAAKEKLELESNRQIVELEPTHTESLQLKYQKSDDIVKLLTTNGSGSGASGNNARLLSPRGSVIADSKTNTIFITDIASKLEDVRNLVAKIDVPIRQVLIEARIVEATDTWGKSLGARLSFVQATNNVTVSGSLLDAGPNIHPASGIPATVYPQNLGVNLPAGSVDGANGSPGSIAALIGSSLTNGLLGLEISALEADGNGKIVSSPRIMTADQTTASIEYGQEIPYQVTANFTTTVQFQNAELRLEVTPQITPDNQIIMKLKLSDDSPGILTTAGYAINTKDLETLARVENGGTVVIGGIYQEQIDNETTKIPFLGDIPYLGVLFRNTAQNITKDELLVFITPKIVRDEFAH